MKLVDLPNPCTNNLAIKFKLVLCIKAYLYFKCFGLSVLVEGKPRKCPLTFLVFSSLFEQTLSYRINIQR